MIAHIIVRADFMNVFQKIAKNTLLLTGAQFIVSVSSLILTIFIARFLGDILFGKFSFALTFTAFFTVFLDLGYNTLLIREVAKYNSEANKYVSNLLSLRFILSIVVFSTIVLLINFMKYPSDTKNIVYLFGIYICIVSLSEVFKLTFRAFEKMQFESGPTIIISIIRVSSSLIVLFLGYGLIEIGIIYVLSAILDFIISFMICIKTITKPNIQFKFYFLKDTIKIALPISFLSVFGFMYKRIDTIMLSIMIGDSAVGWYNAAYNLILGFTPIAQLFMSALFPLMANFSVSAENSLKTVYEKALRYLVIVAVFIAIILTLLANKIILLFYGKQFYSSIIVLQILAWDILLIFIYMVISFMLVSVNKQNVAAIVTAVAALINILLNLLLIPNYSYIGAAISTILTETLLVILCFIIISNNFHKISFGLTFVRPLMSGLILSLWVYVLKDLNLYLVFFSAFIVYFAALYLTKSISRDDFDILRKLIRD